MSEASMIGVFNSKVAAFNEAVHAKDIDEVCDIGREMINIALEQCSNPNVSMSIKNTYRKQCAAVIAHIVNYAKDPQVAVTRLGDGNETGVDPYYTEKNWFSDDVPDLNFTDVIGVQEVKDAFMVDVIAPLKPEFRAVYKSSGVINSVRRYCCTDLREQARRILSNALQVRLIAK